MELLFRHLTTGCLLVLALGLMACQEKDTEKLSAEQPAPAALEPGMRAYVDPVTGEYAPAPPQPPAEPQPSVPSAAISTPSPKTPVEVPLPKGGVMIELGDQFQTEDQAAE